MPLILSREHLKHSQKRAEDEESRRKKGNQLDLCRAESFNFGRSSQANLSNIKKTTSYESMFEGWENFESVKEVEKERSEIRESRGRDQMFQSVESEPNEVFYSVNESKHEKILE